MSAAAFFERDTMPSRRDNQHVKNLRALLGGLHAGAVPDVQVTGLTLDSRSVRPGAAFIALPGLRTHGIEFAAQAVSAGAQAILWQPAPGVTAPRIAAGIPLIAMDDLAQILGTIADRFFDAPSQSVRVTGVTGTNGKTTTAHVIAAAAQHLGLDSAYAGTLGFGCIGALQPATHTTPDSITVHRQLAELRDTGVRCLAMEVSSHALDQRRVDAVRFDTAVFTNLTRDHLDYHGTFESYAAAKAQLFARPELQHAVINADDAFGRALLAHAPSLPSPARAGEGEAHLDSLLRGSEGGPGWGHAITPTASLTAYSRAALPGLPPAARSLFATRVVAGAAGLQLDVDGSWGAGTLSSRFIGDFNVENLLAALAALLGWDVPLRDALAALERCSPPAGRMETLSVPGQPLVIVDYAHTPDALEKVLRAARAHCTGKLICVFGCGGERDPGKRPLMGAVAERLADSVIITDDNPRSEDGGRIVAGIVAGLAQPHRALIERDRAAAIARAIALGTGTDVVLVAGKGHEDYQIVGAERRSFSDRDVALAALRRHP